MQLLHWAKNNFLLSYPIIIALILVFRQICLGQLKYHLKIYQTVLFPGVVLHEMSHLVFCYLTGAQVHDVEFFSPSGGYVSHSKPKIPVVGVFLISLAPFLVGMTLVYLLTPRLITFDAGSLTFKAIAGKVIIFYLLVAIIISMFPSGKDFKNAWPIYTAIIIISIIAGRFVPLSTKATQNMTGLLLGVLGILICSSIILYLFQSTVWKTQHRQ